MAVSKYHLRDKEKIISCLSVIEPSVTALLHSLLGSLSLAAAVMETLFFSRRETQSEPRSNKACVFSPSLALSLSPLKLKYYLYSLMVLLNASSVLQITSFIFTPANIAAPALTLK